ncbi:MAG: bis(5'-nucleosyl)-tetraphosphatase (symmetrical) YqeK [Oscillospiraceae bacterium]
MTSNEARKQAKAQLSEERFYHTECVARAAEELAQRFGADVERSRTAAYLHDILKERNRDDLLQMLRRSDIINSMLIERCPALWHSFAGGEYVENELGCDREIADAVRYHTAGRVDMTLLDKIVFLADYISEDRDFRGADEVREIAKDSLESACMTALRNGLIHLFKQYKFVNASSVDAYNYFVITETE